MNKSIGLSLLTLSILIIILTIFHSFRIFQGNIEPPQIFQESQIEQVIPDEVNAVLNQQIEKLFPMGSSIKLMNLISWSIFAFILVTAGGKIGDLGIKLINGRSKS